MVEIKLFATPEDGGVKEEITNLYWFERNGVKDFSGKGRQGNWKMEIVIDDEMVFGNVPGNPAPGKDLLHTIHEAGCMAKDIQKAILILSQCASRAIGEDRKTWFDGERWVEPVETDDEHPTERKYCEHCKRTHRDGHNCDDVHYPCVDGCGVLMNPVDFNTNMSADGKRTTGQLCRKCSDMRLEDDNNYGDTTTRTMETEQTERACGLCGTMIPKDTRLHVRLMKDGLKAKCPVCNGWGLPVELGFKHMNLPE
jgi:hypothetical protein